MTTPSTPSMFSLFTTKPFVLMLAASLSTVFLAWTLSTQVFFGHGFIGLLGMSIGPLVVGILVFGFFDTEIEGREGSAAVTALFLAVGIGLLTFSISTNAQLSLSVGRINNTLDNATKLRGERSAFAAEFKAATKDAKTARANIDMINDLMRATSNQQEVVNFLAAAAQFDLDASFVSGSGVVRLKDRQALYRRAMDLSGQGNQQAASFLQNNEAVALR